jgi:predicted DNA-binding ribbon-helix-helix protein
MKSAITKRSIVIAGHKTSVSLEDEFWQSLKEIVRGRNVTLSFLVADIDARRPHGNLSSAIRLFVLDYFRRLRRALSPTFPAGELAFFIPWRWWPRFRRGASRPARAAWLVQRLLAARW